MSANNQILVKKHNNKYYVFDNIMSESWSDKNELHLSDSVASFDEQLEAISFANKLDSEDEYGFTSEYGVILDVLCKDGADVTIMDYQFGETNHGLIEATGKDSICIGYVSKGNSLTANDGEIRIGIIDDTDDSFEVVLKLTKNQRDKIFGRVK